MNKFEDKISSELDKLRRENQFRELRTIGQDSSGQTIFGEQQFLNLSSNDYLALGANIALRREFLQQAAADAGNAVYAPGSTSSRLLTGNYPGCARLENLLSGLYNGRAALLLNSGYHANIGILPALSSKRDLILSDKLNHASIIDGLRLTEADFKRYRHLDCKHLEELLEKYASGYDNIFIISESVFSMDGDIADLPELVRIKKRFNAVLLLDEAHAAGVFGPGGGGIAEQCNLIDEVDLIIGTFGKAFASTGAFVICSPAVKSYLVNKMRPLIFTTALPPLCTAWTTFAARKIAGMTAERQHLQNMAARLRDGLRAKGYETRGESQIVPLIIGGNKETGLLAEKMRQNQILALPVRPPTVPKNSARLRLSLTAAITEEQLEKILDIL